MQRPLLPVFFILTFKSLLSFDPKSQRKGILSFSCFCVEIFEMKAVIFGMEAASIGDLAWATTDHALEQDFSAYGVVIDSKIINDRETGGSRGLGFVTSGDEKSMGDANEAIYGRYLDDRNITVMAAKSHERSRLPSHHNRGSHRSGGYGGRGGRPTGGYGGGGGRPTGGYGGGSRYPWASGNSRN